MSQTFDGYHKWLGIAPDEQPPHHYRLLGLKRFESDPEVIDNAAERQMAHVRNAQAGKHAALSQKLLNEIAAARRVLLDSEQRKVYDQQLKRQEPRRAVPLQAQAIPSVEPLLQEIVESDGVRRRPQRVKKTRMPLIVGSIAVVAITAVGWMLLPIQQSPTEPTVVRRDSQDPSPPAGPDRQFPAANSSPASSPAAEPEPDGDTKTEKQEPLGPDKVPANDSGDPPVAIVTAGSPPASPDSGKPNLSTPAPSVVSPPSTARVAIAPGANPWPVPDEAERTAAAEAVRRTHARELSAATSKPARAALGKTLLAEASALASTQPTGAEPYALIERARQLAIDAGVLNLALAAADLLARTYDVDRLEVRLAVFESFSRQLKVPQARSDLAEQLTDEGAEALWQDAPQDAEVIFAALKRNIIAFKQPALKKRIDLLAALAAKRRTDADAIRQAEATLSADPADPDANRILGQQKCLKAADFQAGMAHLAQAGDQRLSALVELEQTSPTRAAEQAQLADKWWDYSVHGKGDLKTVATRRALYWYEVALPELAPAARKKAEKRLLETKDPLAALLPRTLTLSLGEGCELRLRLISPGSFIMGSPAQEADRKPDEVQHPVLLTRPFYISETEITQQQAQCATGVAYAFFKGDPVVTPAAGVAWFDCQGVCDRLSRIGADRGLKFRLPSEAEWEYACRAGSTTAFCSGDSPAGLNEFGWSRNDEDLQAHAVATRRPNAFGVYDLHGNLNEWCADWYGPYPGGGQLVVNPHGPEQGTDRIWRGGSWYEFAPSHRSAARNHSRPGDGDRILGIRVVCDRAF